MDIERVWFGAGVVLLSASALVGFVQYREREHPESFARWRVVHTGGTSGAVQLIGLGVALAHFGVHGAFASAVAAGIAVATYAFFLGPLARALGLLRTASLFNAIGAAVALPAYGTLPFLLVSSG